LIEEEYTMNGQSQLFAILFTLILALVISSSLEIEDTKAQNQPPAGSTLLSNGNGQNKIYNGIGQYRGRASCTAVFIRVIAGEQISSSTPAYALTSGHCVKFFGTNEVMVDQVPGQSIGNIQLIFDYFYDTGGKWPVRVKKIAWASMKGADLAVLELDKTFSEMTERGGIQPWALNNDEPVLSEAIKVVGVPVTGIPPEDAFLRLAECSSGPQANLIEYRWFFNDAWSNQCADIVGGSSGSPVISATGNRLLALLNTTTSGSPHYGDCFLNRPCEVLPTGPDARESTNYAVGLKGLKECFDSEGRFDLNRPACPLDNGKQLQLSGYPWIYARPYVSDGGANMARPLTWNATVSGDDYAFYRYKIGREEETDCRNPAGYSQVFRVQDRNRIDEPIPESEGRYYLCLLGGASPEVDETWQPPRLATRIHVKIDTTPPLISPRYIVYESAETFAIDPLFALPELTDYRYKLGKSGATNCHADEGYLPYLRFPVRINKADQPITFCLIGYDFADNATPPKELLISGDQVTELLPSGAPPRRIRRPDRPGLPSR
jgi:hypothetical protein